MEKNSVSRKTYLDVLRILAIFLVYYNHTFGFEFFLTCEAPMGLGCWLAVLIAVLTIMDIPLFWLISGALMLGKEESYRQTLGKRVWRYVVLLLCASVAAYLMKFHDTASVPDFFLRLTQVEIHNSYWFLYSYLGYLLALPFLRKIAKTLNGRDVIFLLALRLMAVTVAPTAQFLLKPANIEILPQQLQLPFAMLDFLFLPLVGDYLANKLPMERIGKKQIGICFGMIVAGSLFSGAITCMEGAASGFSQNYLGLWNYASAISLFVIARWFFGKHPVSEKWNRFLAAVSSTVIGIYLMEPVFTVFFHGWFFRNVPWTFCTITCASVVWCILCLVMGYMLTMVLRKIPGVKGFL